MSGGYELHQKLRTKTVRQLKKKDYDGAIKSLYDGSKQLLSEKEQGSGCDLACYLVDVYTQGQVKSDEQSRSRIIDLIALAAPDFWRKKVIDAALKWSITVTGAPAADGYLRLAIAEILTKEGNYIAAEPHYIAACSPPPAMASSDLFAPHAPKSFACMMLDWLEAHAAESAKESGETRKATSIERVGAGAFALRGLLPLLLARAMTNSRAYLNIYISRLVQKHPNLLLPTKPNPKPYAPPAGMSAPADSPQQLYLTASPDLNFAQMAFAMVSQAVDHKRKTGGARVPDQLREGWSALVNQYEQEADSVDDEYLAEVLPQLGSIYFDIQLARPQGGNFMQDMLGSLMGGGAPGAGAANQARTVTVKSAPPPAISKSKDPAHEAATGEAGTAANGGEDLDLD